MNQQYVLQNNMFDCGIAALKTIFLAFGRRIETEDIVNWTINQGITALQLIKASKKKGIDAKGVKTDITHLNNKILPCIAHVIKDKNYFHYLVILKNNNIKKIITIHDPAFGIKKLTYDEFNDITTGVFIMFDSKAKVKITKDDRFIKILKDLLITNKKLIIKSFSLSLIFIFLSLLFSYYLKLIISFSHYFIIIFLIFMFISLFKNMIEYLRNKIIIKLNKEIDDKINKTFVNHILFLPYKYYLSLKKGELIALTSDIENFKNIVVKIFILCFVDVIIIALIVLFMSFYNIYYLLIFLLLIGITEIITLKYQKIFNQNYLSIKNNKIVNSENLVESLDSFNTIKNLLLEEKIKDKLDSSNVNALNKNFTYDLNNNRYIFLTNLVEEIFLVFIIFITIYLSQNNNFNILNVVLFGNIFYMFIGFLNNINENIVMYKIYNTSINRVLDLLDRKQEQQSLKTENNFSNIIYENVSFSCNNKQILKNVNFKFNSKDLIYITGSTGSGKSTLIKLLLKYYENYEGKIKLDNIDLSYIESNRVRKNITYVSQDEKLFVGTLYDNLNIVNESQIEQRKAMEICEISMNSNYMLEENGQNLSGGERKKVLIARSLLKNSSIIIFDESFNELDIKTERNILTNIIENYPNLGIILISHRKSNIDLFKKSYILKNKKLIEMR